MDVGKNHLHDTALVHRILRIDTSRGCVLTQPVGRRKLEHRMDYPKESLYIWYILIIDVYLNLDRFLYVGLPTHLSPRD